MLVDKRLYVLPSYHTHTQWTYPLLWHTALKSFVEIGQSSIIICSIIYLPDMIIFLLSFRGHADQDQDESYRKKKNECECCVWMLYMNCMINDSGTLPMRLQNDLTPHPTAVCLPQTEPWRSRLTHIEHCGSYSRVWNRRTWEYSLPPQHLGR